MKRFALMTTIALICLLFSACQTTGTTATTTRQTETTTETTRETTVAPTTIPSAPTTTQSASELQAVPWSLAADGVINGFYLDFLYYSNLLADTEYPSIGEPMMPLEMAPSLVESMMAVEGAQDNAEVLAAFALCRDTYLVLLNYQQDGSNANLTAAKNALATAISEFGVYYGQ